jgi:hypothetical protein
MRPLTLDDLLPLEEYAGRRREFFESLNRYLDRYRRVRIGPRLTLLFENRQTLWFRVQELLRVSRLAEPGRVQQELNLYNRLLPGRDRLQAALLIAIPDEGRSPSVAAQKDRAIWQQLRDEHLWMTVGETRYPSHLVTCRPEDRSIGAAHWVEFSLDADARELLRDMRLPARFEVALPAYRHESPLLSEDLRESLLEDLEMSDKD